MFAPPGDVFGVSSFSFDYQFDGVKYVGIHVEAFETMPREFSNR